MGTNLSEGVGQEEVSVLLTGSGSETAAAVLWEIRLPRIAAIAHRARQAAAEGERVRIPPVHEGFSMAETVLDVLRGDDGFSREEAMLLDIMLLYLIPGPRKKAASLMEKDRIRQCADVTGLKKIQIDMICLWRQLENRVGGHLLHLSLCFKCGCLNLN